MSAGQYRRDLERKRAQRLDAEKKAGEYRTKESTKRTDAANARQAAARSNSALTSKSKLQEAERREKEAASAGKDAAAWQSRATSYVKEETAILGRLTRAEQSEADSRERDRKRQQEQVERRHAADRAALDRRVALVETSAQIALRSLPAPKPEKLRVLILSASAEGDLRVGREAARIRSAVESALHRSLIELDVRPAATTSDLLDGLARFRPHVVHFSGHSGGDLIVFEDDVDEQHDGVVVTAKAFARAVGATDTPPLLVVLNSCDSVAQANALAQSVVPFAIGMADSIDDADAISYAARFYSAVADGQSVRASHQLAQAGLELSGLQSADLPILACATDADPAATFLVAPPGSDDD